MFEGGLHPPEERYRPLEGHEKYSGDLSGVAEVDKNKFPLDYFPNCKWSRKGYMRTRWEIGGTELDFVNIHLFHDACNIIAIEAVSSSLYTIFQDSVACSSSSSPLCFTERGKYI